MEETDIFIIGGGVNGCGIARDAAGRGLTVRLAEMGDLASSTSSASTKLFHGGLRYLEYFELRLVKEALIERETLLRAMPHISWPMRFVLPYHKSMRFEGSTPTSRLLGLFMPWLKGRRPAWLIRFGLFLYDSLGKRDILEGTTTIDLTRAPEGGALRGHFEKAYEYSDCWIEDARLVSLTARDAADRGADILVRTRVTSATPDNGRWIVETDDLETGVSNKFAAKMLVNAAGPWVASVISSTIKSDSTDGVRLVRGSHIVTRRLFEHDKCYFFQGTDGRIIFAIPYETDFTLIGTTDADHSEPNVTPECSDEERDYLIDFANQYFANEIGVKDIVWSFAGVRPLLDDGEASASAATREYRLKTEIEDGAPVLNIFGGKITTHRKLAESALAKIGEHFPGLKGNWTAGVPLPGGDFALENKGALGLKLSQDYPFLNDAWAQRMIRTYGNDAWTIFKNAKGEQDIGPSFGATLTGAEVAWLMDKEFARTAEDVIWRRTKLGLIMDGTEVSALDDWMKARRKQMNS